VGQPLVEPRTRPVELTVAGRVLAEHGRAAVSRLQAAERDLAELAETRESRIRLGSFPTALATFVPRAVRRLRARQPDVSVWLVDDHMQGLWPRLQRRELDVAIVFTGAAPTPVEGFVVTPLFTDTYQILLPRGHRLSAPQRPLRLRDLADDTWVGAGPGSTWFRIVAQACRDSGFEPRVGLGSDDYVAVQAFVQAGMGVAVVPGLAAARRMPGVDVRSIRGRAPARQIAVAYPDSLFVPHGVLAMVEALQAVTRETASGSRTVRR
jgi:DNA-binding transcriptional LysR family regulator